MTTAKKSEKEIELLTTVQIAPGEEPLKPGKQKLPADVAEDLVEKGLAK